MGYELSRKLAEYAYKHWVSYELFSFNWFFIIIVNAIFYTIWLKLLDKSKISQLLLIGSLSTVGFMFDDILLFGFLGVAEYKVSILPLEPPLFIMSVTIAPIIIMLVQQYMPTWKSYFLFLSIGMAFLAFVLLPIYSLLGIFQLHNWNYFYHFLILLLGGLVARVVFCWIIGIETSKIMDIEKHSTYRKSTDSNIDTENITENDIKKFAENYIEDVTHDKVGKR